MTTERPPIFYGITQMHYGSVPAVAKKIADLNGRFRELGFPNFEEVSGQRLNITANQIGGHDIKFEESVTWIFGNKAKTTNFLLTASSLAIQTVTYESHEELFASFLQAANLMQEVLELDGFSRLGFRVLNSVGPSAQGRPARDFIAPGLLGIELGRPRLQAIFQQAFESPMSAAPANGFLVARTLTTRSAVSFPPDLLPIGLVVADAAASASNSESVDAHEYILLDFDHYLDSSDPLPFDSMNAILLKLHGGTKSLLSAHLNEDGKSRWKL